MRLKIIPKIQSKFYLNQVIKSVFLKKTIDRFEDEFSKITGIKHCAAAFTGRSALIAILNSLNLSKGDEIIMPGFTFQGITHIIIDMGFIPVFADVSNKTLNINPDKIEELISKKTKVLLIVHNMGNPCDMGKIIDICRKNKLLLIEDCAHSISSKYKGKNIGTFGDATLFSFHYSKIINTFWGGMACTNNPKIAANVKKNIGKFKKQSVTQIGSRLFIAASQSLVTTPFIYSLFFYPLNKLFCKLTGEDIIETLFKLKPQDLETHMYKYSDFQAGIGIEELKKLVEYNKKRKNLHKLFKSSLKNKIWIQEQLEGTEFVPLQLIILHKNKTELIDALLKDKIEAKSFYVHYLPSVPEFSRYRNNCSEAKELENKIIYFPTFQYQTKNDIKYIGEKILSHTGKIPEV